MRNLFHRFRDCGAAEAFALFAAIDRETIDDRLVIVFWRAVHQKPDDSAGCDNGAGYGLVILPGLGQRFGVGGDKALLLRQQFERQYRRPVALADGLQPYRLLAHAGSTGHGACPISIARASIGVTTP